MRRLRVRLGDCELELEAAEDLSDADLKKGLGTLRELGGLSRPERIDNGEASEKTVRRVEPTTLDASLNTYVSRLGGGSSRALLNAAGLHLTLADGLTTFTRDTLFERASQAHEWQRDFSNQRSRDLRRMISAKEIIEKAGGMYTMPPKVLIAAREKLQDLMEQ